VRAAVVVRVSEILDVFGQVAEEEDVAFADFARDFDLCRLYQTEASSEVIEWTYVGTIAECR
jgi:hypothetical protein